MLRAKVTIDWDELPENVSKWYKRSDLYFTVDSTVAEDGISDIAVFRYKGESEELEYIETIWMENENIRAESPVAEYEQYLDDLWYVLLENGEEYYVDTHEEY